MHAIKQLQNFTLRNPATGAECSPWGAIPPGYTERVDVRWALSTSEGTIIGRYGTEAEAVDAGNAMNERERARLAEHAEQYPETAADCRRRSARIPVLSLRAVPA